MKRHILFTKSLNSFFVALIYGLSIVLPLTLAFVFYYFYAQSLFAVGFLTCCLINIVLSIIVLNDRIDRHQSETKLKRLAHFDMLTGLPNRNTLLSLIVKSLEKARKKKEMVAICFIDIDNFKQINDHFGHHIGDEMLRMISTLIQSRLRKKDFMARLGGDEFGLILKNINSQTELENLLKEIIEFTNQSIRIRNLQLTKSISLGAVIYPLAGENPDELIRLADIAMYRAKELGKNNFQIYNQHVHKMVVRKQQLDNYMCNAIINNEFYLLYQPQIDITNNMIMGIEVLMYWHNPILGGRIFPNEFISIAEDNGLIYPLGEWVLKKATQDYNEFINRCRLNDIDLAVNISIKQLEDPNFLNLINQTLREENIKRENLILEIREASLMKNIEKTTHSMDEFKKAGIRFALDDFGSGFSSMEYLRKLPISVLKIDRSFIKNIDDKKNALMILSTLQLANALEIKTIAKGVEKEQQLQFLKDNGCLYVQGFYFAKPMRIQQLIQFGLYVPHTV